MIQQADHSHSPRGQADRWPYWSAGQRHRRGDPSAPRSETRGKTPDNAFSGGYPAGARQGVHPVQPQEGAAVAARAEVDVSLTGTRHTLCRQGRGGLRGEHATTVHSTPRASLLFPPKHNTWRSICDAKAPLTAFGPHSLVPAFDANRASARRGGAGGLGVTTSWEGCAAPDARNEAAAA